MAIEIVDCKDLAEVARHLDGRDRRTAIVALLDLFRKSTVGMNDAISEAISDLQAHKQGVLVRWPALRAALRKFFVDGQPTAVTDAIDALISHPAVKRFRIEILEELAHAAYAVERGECASFAEAAWAVRDQTRRVGRRPEPRIVSRTLLVKGLEFDHAVILDPTELTANDLYVALTRGSRSVAVVHDGSSLIEYER